MEIIAGTYRRRRLFAPKGLTTRPTSSRLRGALFNIVQNQIQGASFLDLFAGSGAMGLEALSRGAKRAVFIESNKEAVRCIRENIKNLGVEEQSLVLIGDAFRLVEKLIRENESFELIFADAPYDESIAYRLLALVDESPILNSEGMLFIEDSAKTHSASLKTLTLLSDRRTGRSTLHQYQKQ